MSAASDSRSVVPACGQHGLYELTRPGLIASRGRAPDEHIEQLSQRTSKGPHEFWTYKRDSGPQRNSVSLSKTQYDQKVLKANPEFADIYGLHPIVSGKDAHEAKRRSAIVQVQSDMVRTIGRSSTARHVEGETLQSAIDPSCALDKFGVYSFRFQHSVARSSFANELHCDFYGSLPEGPRNELQAYWEDQLYR